MVKHTQTVRRLLPTNCLHVFGHFVGLALTGLELFRQIRPKKTFTWSWLILKKRFCNATISRHFDIFSNHKIFTNSVEQFYKHIVDLNISTESTFDYMKFRQFHSLIFSTSTSLYVKNHCNIENLNNVKVNYYELLYLTKYIETNSLKSKSFDKELHSFSLYHRLCSNMKVTSLEQQNFKSKLYFSTR